VTDQALPKKALRYVYDTTPDTLHSEFTVCTVQMDHEVVELRLRIFFAMLLEEARFPACNLLRSWFPVRGPSSGLRPQAFPLFNDEALRFSWVWWKVTLQVVKRPRRIR